MLASTVSMCHVISPLIKLFCTTKLCLTEIYLACTHSQHIKLGTKTYQNLFVLDALYAREAKTKCFCFCLFVSFLKITNEKTLQKEC